MNTAHIIAGDSRASLEIIPDQSVQCVVTSPPYWGLRDYGTAEWEGGDPNCSHRRETKKSDKTITGHKNFDDMLGVGDAIYKDSCPRCGAIRQDSQVGLESDPDQYVSELCDFFDEVWRVLKDDGTLWLNIGDTYSSYKDSKAVPDSLREGDGTAVPEASNRNPATLKKAGLKHKELVGIPWRVAFEMQRRGWYLRQDIIWAKPNPMPESVRDRCTKSHEYIFLLTKKPNYFYDHEAIKTPVKQDWGTRNRTNGKYHNEGTGLQPHSGLEKSYKTANKRDVWTVNTRPYKEAHFATFPPDLIRPCILAGTSEHGECVDCGTAWKRAKKSNEFEKQCKCETTEVRPQTVMDIFSGAGTTGVVSAEHFRNYIGLELNPKYAQLSKNRLEALNYVHLDVTLAQYTPIASETDAKAS